MNIDFGSLAFNMNIQSGGGTPSWGTALGQNELHKITFLGYQEFIPAMVYKMVPNMNLVKCPLGKGGNKPEYSKSLDFEYVIASKFDNIFVNDIKIRDASFILLITKELNTHHTGRLTLKYSPKVEYNSITNEDCFKKIQNTLDLGDNAAWFITDINIYNQDELHFRAFIGDKDNIMNFKDSAERKKYMLSCLPENYEGELIKTNLNLDTKNTLQTIFYGAPGTGKSHSVKRITGENDEIGEEVKEDKLNVFRTTFHPDSDYASFVGCYKPIMKGSKEHVYSKDELISKLTDLKTTGTPYAVHKFGAEYWYSLKKLSPTEKKEILTACGVTDSYSVEIDKCIAVGEEYLTKDKEEYISYSFTPQAFTNAYIYAYQHTEEPTYLVIEEINRGNCAQIFGDLFQLLDRKNGVSEYKIKADADLADYLIKELGDDNEGIKGGKLCLPDNLHILATMNTSDQSLFPIDSAFKRRWDWQYVPIQYDDSISSSFTITIGEKIYNWVNFIEKVNAKIFDINTSEDKQMGNFFIKQSIDEKQFVGKVMFYLWSEILKDEYENTKYFFRVSDNNKFTFNKLFNPNSSEIINGFMAYLGVNDTNNKKENEESNESVE